MCGLLLRAVALSVIFYFLLDITSSVHIVTLGGQILGSAIVGVLAALLHTASQKILSSEKLRIVFATLWTAAIAYLTAKTLPGYIIVDAMGAVFILVQVCVAASAAGMLIKDK